jgi:hypothetical protein
MQEHDYNEDDTIDENYHEAAPQPRYVNLFCMRCGEKLKLDNINEFNLVEYYYCTNEKCVHHDCVLEMKHPVYDNRGPGESYALCWIK